MSHGPCRGSGRGSRLRFGVAVTSGDAFCRAENLAGSGPSPNFADFEDGLALPRTSWPGGCCENENRVEMA